MILLSLFGGDGDGAFGLFKVLHYFMRIHHHKTMAFLTGILLGSLRKIWPWKETLETTEARRGFSVRPISGLFPLTGSSFWPYY